MHTYIQIWNHFFANQRPALSKLQPQHLHCRHPRPRAQFDKSKTRSGGRPKVCRLLGATFQIAPWAGGVGLRAKKPKFKVSLLFQKKNWAALRAPPRDRVSDSHVQKFSVKENQCHDHRRWTGGFFFGEFCQFYWVNWFFLNSLFFRPGHLLKKPRTFTDFF